MKNKHTVDVCNKCGRVNKNGEWIEMPQKIIERIKDYCIIHETTCDYCLNTIKVEKEKMFI